MTRRLLPALVAVCAGSFVAACASSSSSRLPEVRPIDEDQLALLPAGADAVVDIDMEQLRTWAPAHRFFSLLPGDARKELADRGIDPWLDLDGMVMSLSNLGTGQPSVTLLLRGDLDAAKLAAGLDVSDYREMKLWEKADRAVAKLSPRMMALGSPVDVRRVVDLVRDQGESLRKADQSLLTAFARAPSARSGRPAVIAALAPSLALKDRLKTDQLPGGEYEWLTFVLAVGDGFDFEIIGKTKNPTQAASLAAEAKSSLDQLRARPLVSLLGITRYLTDIVIVDRGDEVRMVYRLAGRSVDHMLARLEQVMAPRK
jgi:hypothetical protein